MPSDVRLLSDLDRIIHEPARLALAAILSVVESADFLYLQRESGLTKGNLSSHLAKMEEAGCHAISFGVESANAEILKTIRKGITIEQVISAVKMCKDAGGAGQDGGGRVRDH